MSDTLAQDGSQSAAESKPCEEADSAPATEEQVRDPSRRGRWYQFRLRTLLGLTLWAAVVAMAWRTYLEPYRRQQQTMDLVERLGGTYRAARAPTWLRRLNVGDMQNVTVVDLGDWDKPESYLDAVAALPALEILAVGGPAFGNEHLRWLARVKTLRGLLLDDTSVSDEALAAFKAALPDVEVYHSQRRLIKSLRRLPAYHCTTMQSRAYQNLQESLDTSYFEEAKQLLVSGGDAMMSPVTRLTSLETVEIAGPKLSEMLSLPRGEVTDAALVPLSNLARLRYLDVSRTDVGDAGLVYLAGLSNLETLNLSETRVTDDGLDQLNTLGRLGTLSLSGTRVTAAGLMRLQQLPNLRDLLLERRQVTPQEIEALQRALRLCRIHAPFH